MKLTEPAHLGQEYAGQTLHWFPMDTEKRYQNHLIDTKKRSLLEQNNWIDREILYTFNSNGFRSDEFNNDQPGYVALGCSFTMGIGLPKEDVWCWQVGDYFKLKTWNLGLGGGSLDQCFRLATYWLEKLNPRFVILLEPPKTRFEVLDNDCAINITPEETSWWQDRYVKTYLATSTNSDINRLKNIQAIGYLCNELNIPFYTWPPFTEQLNTRSYYTDFARDLAHNGPIYNRDFANKVIKYINNQPQ